MAVTKLAVNAKPGLDKSTRSRVRAVVHAVERSFSLGEAISFEHGPYAEAMGQVLHLERFQPVKAVPLKRRLLAQKEAALNQLSQSQNLERVNLL